MNSRVESHVFSPSEKERYYYYTKGNKKDPAICIIPGFTGLHDDLLPLARLFGKDHYVITPELPGWGKSTPLPQKMTIENYAVYIKSLLDHLGISQAILIGHCMGSVVTLSFCEQFPKIIKQAFVISVPYQEGTLSHEIFRGLVHLSFHTPKRWRWIWYLWRNRLFSMTWGFVFLRSRSLHKKTSRIIEGFFLQGAANEESVEENWSSLITFPFNKAAQIITPVHIIHGAKDIIIPLSQAEKFHQLIPKATFDIIGYAGHLPPVESVEGLGGVIKKYL